MQFRDLNTQYQLNKDSIDKAIGGVIAGGQFIGGRQVSELEDLLAEYTETKNCITCANGTDALQLALMAWNIGDKDAVFVPDFTFFSSGEVVSNVGATPIFVDVEADTYNISVNSLRKCVSHVINETDLNPRVIIAVDLFGQPANYDEIKKVAKEFNLLILEDSAQGFGGSILTEGQRKMACSFGDISTTSFFPAKPLGCYGDGGAIFTDNDEWADIIRSLKVHGKGSDKYDNVRIGMNSRLDTIQAAVLLEKMSFFDEEVKKCNEVAVWYEEGLRENDRICIPRILDGFESSWAQYTILLPDAKLRDNVINELKKNNIPAMIYYKKPMHLQGAFEDVLKLQLECENTLDICSRCLSLPMSAYVKKEEVKMITDIINNVIK